MLYAHVDVCGVIDVDVLLQSKADKSECSRHTNVPTVIMQHLHGKDMALAKD